MSDFLWPGLVADLVLVAALLFGVYLPRHRKPSMVVPYIGINIGVFAVGSALVGADLGIGVGIGLFGVLSIIRLRSEQISHGDVVYYFSSLAVGLVCAIPLNSAWTGPGLGLLIVVVMAVADQPAWHRRHRQEVVVLDHVYPREELEGRLLDVLQADSIIRYETTMTDLVRDTQMIDVSYRIARSTTTGAARRRPAPVHSENLR